MKKAVMTVLSVLFSVLLCSCGAPDGTALSGVLKQPYEAEAEIKDKENVYTVFISFEGDALLFKFSKPELLRGVSYGFTDGQSVIDYDGLRIPFDLSGISDKISGGAPVWKKLLEAEGEYTVRRTGEQYVMTDGKTEYRFDKITSAPAVIKSGNITITFTEFRVKNDKTS